MQVYRHHAVVHISLNTRTEAGPCTDRHSDQLCWDFKAFPQDYQRSQQRWVSSRSILRGPSCSSRPGLPIVPDVQDMLDSVEE